jgi:L-cysteine desulfidase
LDDIEVMRDLFQQTVNELKSKPQNQTLIQQIDMWERDSIEKIRKEAENIRELCIKHTAENLTQIEIKLNTLTDQLRQSREEEDIFESDLRQWKKQLTHLTEQLDKSSDISLNQDPTPLITKICVTVTSSKCNRHLATEI